MEPYPVAHQRSQLNLRLLGQVTYKAARSNPPRLDMADALCDPPPQVEVNPGQPWGRGLDLYPY